MVNLRFGDLRGVRGLGEREGGEKGEGKEGKGQADEISPRESLSLAVFFALSSVIIFPILLASRGLALSAKMMPQRSWDVKRGRGCLEKTALMVLSVWWKPL